MAADIFNLEGRRGGPPRPHPASTWTAEEQASKLEGYLEIDSEFWASIRVGTHVRYVSKAEGFRPGGFVQRNPDDRLTDGVARRHLVLQNGFYEKARGYLKWSVAYEDVARVYIKPDAGTLMVMKTLEEAVRGLNENIRKLVEHVKKMEGRLKIG